MSFITLKLLYSSEGYHRKNFNWFICSKRFYDPITGFTYIELSKYAKFYGEKNGIEWKVVADGIKLLILSDSSTRKKMCEEIGCEVRCDSDRDLLSTECELVTNSSHLIELSKKISFIYPQFSGIAIQHECVNTESRNSPICYRATFVIKKRVILPLKDSGQCRLIKYAKRHNIQLKKNRTNFPSCEEIDEMVKEFGCKKVSKILEKMI